MKSLRSILKIASCLAVALLVYILVLSYSLPRQVGLTFRYEISSVLLISGVLLYLSFSLKGWPGHLASLVLTMVLFALPLSGLWSSAVSEFYVAGLLPFSDANANYMEAYRLIEGIPFTAFASRRPLFSSVTAFLLVVTRYNLQFTLAIFVALNALACYLLAREVQRLSGTAASVVVFLLTFLFYRRWGGTLMSENLGFLLGVAGMAVLLRSSAEKQRLLALAGILLITLGLNARAGTFFVLPMLVLWCDWYFRGGGRLNWKMAGLACIPVVLGFAVSQLFLMLFGSQEGVLFSNFAYTLYGLVKGGVGWTSLVIDHPELGNLENGGLGSVYSLIFTEFTKNPSLFFEGVGKAYKMLFAADYSGLFGFVDGEHVTVVRTSAYISCIVLFALLAIGVVQSIRSRKTWASLLLFAGVGILVSVPFAPPWDGFRLRTYAATFPIVFIIVGSGVSFLFSLVRLKFIDAPRDMTMNGLSLVYGITLFAGVLLGPLVVKEFFSRPSSFRQVACPPGYSAVYFRLPVGSYINIVSNDAAGSSWLPDLRQSDYVKGVHGLSPMISEKIDKIEPPTTVTTALELKSQVPIWVAMNTNSVPVNPVIMAACGRWDETLRPLAFQWLLASSLQEVSR